MRYDRDRHRRRSTRLKGYDYAQPGAYFITIVARGRECLFGEVEDGMLLNDAGRMVERWWAELGAKFPRAIPDTHVVMPNHFHGIVIIADEAVDDGGVAEGAHAGAPLRTVASLQKVVQWFKTMTTNEYIRGVRNHGWTPFLGKLWQRNYYDHIIRNKASLNRIRQYIADNPANWDDDAENPTNAAR